MFRSRIAAAISSRDWTANDGCTRSRGEWDDGVGPSMGTIKTAVPKDGRSNDPPVGPGGRVAQRQRWPAAMTRLELASADRNMTTRKACERSMGFM